MGKNTINFPHMFFPIWSIGLFFAMGEYPMIDELGLSDLSKNICISMVADTIDFIQWKDGGFFQCIWRMTAKKQPIL